MSNNRYDFGDQETIALDRACTKLLYVSTAKYGGDWGSIMHTHAHAEIFYVVGGEGQFNIEGSTYPVVRDDMVVVNSNIGHTELGMNASPLEYVVLGIEGLEFSASGENGGNGRFCVVNFHRERDAVLHYLRCMLWEIEHKTAGYTTVCQDLLEILLILLMRRIDFSLVSARQDTKSLKNCAAVRRYIDEHFKENLNLDGLAKLAHFNRYYMSHSFSRQYGVSPINYLIARRIEESRYLLTQTGHSLSQIANMLGFSSSSYFSQSFRRLEGISPKEYRRRHRDAAG